MKAAVLYGPRDLRIEEVSDPQLSDGEALIRLKSVGICGTDLMVYQGLHKSSLPVIQGHEYAGTIAGVRGESGGFTAGDRVFARGSWGCGSCNWCMSGLPALCSGRRMLGISVNGCMAEYVKVPTSTLFRLPDTVRFEEAQSLVTVACAVNLANKLRPRLGMNAVVFGPGHTGLIIMQVLKLMGVDKVVVVGGRRESRLQLAGKLGADLALSGHDPQLYQKIERFIPQGPEVVVESSGSGDALKQAVKVVSAGGTVAAFSIYGRPIDGFEAKEFYNKEISIFGVKGAGNCYLDASRLLEKRGVQINPLVSHVFKLEETVRAFEMMSDRASDALRILINPE
ncbi:MAG: zinc-dependent alcohol dehydrogenase [Desulfocucumaceae bacterium]